MHKTPTEQLLSVRLASWLTLMLLFLLPLIYLPQYGTYASLRYFVFGICSLVLGLATAWTWLRASWIFQAFVKSPWCYGILVYLFAFVLVSLTSVDRVASIWSSYQRTDGAFTILFLTIFALNIFTLTIILGKAIVYRFFAASVFGAAILSLLILVPALFSQVTWFATSLGGATIGNSSLAAAYVLWNIFFSLILIIHTNARRFKFLWLLCGLILITSPLFINWQFQSSHGLLALIGSARGAAFGTLAGIVLAGCLWLTWQPSKKTKYLGMSGLLALLGAGVIAGYELLVSSSGLHRIFAHLAGENRFIFWKIAWHAFVERPIFGWGPYTFNVPYQLWYDPRMVTLPYPETWVDHAHNLIFETLSSGGIVLLLGLVFFLLTIVWGLLIARKQKQVSAIEAGLLLGALLGWFIQAQFIFDSLVSLAMLFLVAGLVYGLIVPAAQKKTLILPNQFRKIVFAGIVGCAVVLFVYGIALPFHKGRTIIAIYRSNLPKRIQLWADLNKGLPTGNGFDSIVMVSRINKLYEEKQESLRSGDEQSRPVALAELDAIGQYLDGALQHKKYDYGFALNGARLFYQRMIIANEFSGPALERALAFSKQTLEHVPGRLDTHPESYWIGAKIQFAAGHYDEGKQLLEQAYALEPKSIQTSQLILQYAQLAHDQAYYDSALKRARQSIPNFPQ